MSETTPETTTPDTPATEEKTETVVKDEAYWKAEADKWKSLSRKNENEKTALQKKADQWDQLEAKNKTELEKLTEELNEARSKLTAHEKAELKRTIAKEAKLPEKYIKYLTGDDEDSLREQAKELVADLKSEEKEDAPKQPRAPKPDPTQGGNKEIALNDLDALGKLALAKVGGRRN